MEMKQSRIMRRRLAGAYASSILSISLVLMLVGVASILIVNARSVADYFKESLQMSVILKEETSEKQALACESKIAALPYVKSTRFVSKEEGTEEMKALLGEDFLSVFETSPIPFSIDVTLKADYVSPDSVALVSSIIEKNAAVDEVSYQQSLVEALNSNLGRIAALLSVFIALLLFISVVLISNTVRLDVYSRRFTIRTMQLVGATRRFITKPFLKRAAFQGLAASGVALIAIGGGLAALKGSLPELFEIFRPRLLALDAVIVVAAGVLVCVASTAVIVRKILSLSKDELYG